MAYTPSIDLAQRRRLMAAISAQAACAGQQWFSSLPDECLLHIFDLLGLADKLRSFQDGVKWEACFTHRAADSVRELRATQLAHSLDEEALLLAHLTGLRSLALECEPYKRLLLVSLPLLLSRLTRLTQLTLSGTEDQFDSDTSVLSRLVGLQQLKLHCSSANWHASLGVALSQLTQLDVSQAAGDFALSACQQLTNLQELTMSHPQWEVGGDEDIWVSRLTALRKLSRLSLVRVTVPTFDGLLQHCRCLKFLSLQSTETRQLPTNFAAAGRLEELVIGPQEDMMPPEQALALFTGFDWSQLLLAPRLRAVLIDREYACTYGAAAFDAAVLNATYRRAQPELGPAYKLITLVDKDIDHPVD